MISNWNNIDNSDSRLKLKCNHEECKSSVCNILYGKLHVTSIHGDFRHSYTFTDLDMKFLISQYILTLHGKEKEDLLTFLKNL